MPEEDFGEWIGVAGTPLSDETEIVSHERGTEGERATPNRRARVADYLGLERNIVLVSAIVFLMGMGEELWKRFLPKYMEALGGGGRGAALENRAADAVHHRGRRRSRRDAGVCRDRQGTVRRLSGERFEAVGTRRRPLSPMRLIQK